MHSYLCKCMRMLSSSGFLPTFVKRVRIYTRVRTDVITLGQHSCVQAAAVRGGAAVLYSAS